MTLRLRFSLAFLANTLLALCLFMSTYYIMEKRAILQSQHEQQRRAIEKAASVCQLIDMASSALVAFDYIDAIKKDPSVRFALCLDNQGKVQAHSDPRWLGRFWKEPAQPNMFLISHPVQVEGSRVGLAIVSYDRERLHSDMHQQLLATLRQLIAIAGLTFLISILGSLLLAWNLSRPIKQLAEGARIIGAGNLDYQSPLVERRAALRMLGQ